MSVITVIKAAAFLIENKSRPLSLSLFAFLVTCNILFIAELDELWQYEMRILWAAASSKFFFACLAIKWIIWERLVSNNEWDTGPCNEKFNYELIIHITWFFLRDHNLFCDFFFYKNCNEHQKGDGEKEKRRKKRLHNIASFVVW